MPVEGDERAGRGVDAQLLGVAEHAAPGADGGLVLNLAVAKLPQWTAEADRGLGETLGVFRDDEKSREEVLKLIGS